MNATSCAAIRAELPEFVGGDIAGFRHDEIRRHLFACAACRGEASALQQAQKALRQAAAAMPPGVDDAMFAAMHADITVAIGREVEVAGAARPHRLVSRVLLASAAVMLFGLGYWLVTAFDDEGVFLRTPMPTAQSTGAPLRAVPWAGPRAHLHQLGFDEADGELQPGSGMMQRLRAREGAFERR